MKEVNEPAGDPKQGHDGSWSQAPSTPTFPTSRVDVWRVRLDEPGKHAPRSAFYLPMRSCAPADFTLKKTEFTSPDVVLHFGACLLATLQFLQPRFASSV